MRKYIEIIDSYNAKIDEDAINDTVIVAEPIDRRETSRIYLDTAAEELAQDEGITILQARRKIQQREEIKRNSVANRKRFWKEKSNER